MIHREDENSGHLLGSLAMFAAFPIASAVSKGVGRYLGGVMGRTLNRALQKYSKTAVKSFSILAKESVHQGRRFRANMYKRASSGIAELDRARRKYVYRQARLERKGSFGEMMAAGGIKNRREIEKLARDKISQTVQLKDIVRETRQYKNRIAQYNAYKKTMVGDSKKAARFWGKAEEWAKMEAAAMPIMYGMHKMEQRNVAPEQRTSFASFYISALPFSIGAAAVQTKFSGFGGKLLGKIGRRIGPKRMTNIVDKSLGYLSKVDFSKQRMMGASLRSAYADTIKPLRQQGGVIGVKKFPYEVIKMARETAKRYHTNKNKLRASREQIKRELSGGRLGKSPKPYQPPSRRDVKKAKQFFYGDLDIKVLRKGLNRIKEEAKKRKLSNEDTQKLYRIAVERHNEVLSRNSGWVNLFNRMLKSAGVEGRKVEHVKVRSPIRGIKKGGKLDDDAILSGGVVKYGAKIHNLENVRAGKFFKPIASFLSNRAVIPGIGRPFATLFNSRPLGSYYLDQPFVEVIQPGSKIGLGYTPKGATDEETLRNLFGAHKYDETDPFETIMHDRMILAGDKQDVFRQRMVKQALDAKTQLFRLRKTESAINIGGQMHVIGARGITRKGIEAKTKGYMFRLGYDPDLNDYRTFSSIPRGGIFEQLSKQYGGLYQGPKTEVDLGEGRVVKYGSMTGVRKEVPEDAGTLRKWWEEKVAKPFEIAHGSEAGLGQQLINFVTRHKDARYPRTLFSDDHLMGEWGNEFINEAVLSSSKNAKVVMQTVNDSLEKTYRETYTKMMRGQTAIETVDNMAKKINAGSPYARENLDDYIIKLDDSTETVMKKVKLLKSSDPDIPLPHSVRQVADYAKSARSDPHMEQFLRGETHRTAGFFSGETFTVMDDYNSYVTQSFVKRQGLNMGEVSSALGYGPGTKAYDMAMASQSYIDMSDELYTLINKGVKRGGLGTSEKELGKRTARKVRRIHNELSKNKQFIQSAIRQQNKVMSLWDSNPNWRKLGDDNISRILIPHFEQISESGKIVRRDQSAWFAKTRADKMTLSSFGGGKEVQMEVAANDLSVRSLNTLSLFESVNRTFNQVGLGFDPATTRTAHDHVKKIMFKRILPATALAVGYGAADAVVDESGLFEGTPLEEGLTGAMGNMLAKARITSQAIVEATGIGGLARYMEDLMPGSISSPLSGLVRGFGPSVLGTAAGYALGGPTKAFAGALLGSAGGMVLGGGPLGVFGMWDISKTREEVIEEYSGREEVAIKKGRFWELGTTPFEGSHTMYYRPNWYHRMRSDYKHAPNFLGSKFQELMGSLDPDYYNDMHYYCLHPDTPIICADRTKLISDMKNGSNTIIGHRGYKCKAIRIHKREMTESDIMLKIAITGHLDRMRVTNKHEILILRYSDCIYKSQRKMGRKCTATDGNICVTCKNRDNKYKIDWIRAEDIQKGDFVLYPIRPDINSNRLLTGSQVLKDKTYRKRGKTKRWFEKRITDGNMISYNIDANGKISNKNMGPDIQVPLNNETGYMFGIIIAEGHIIRGGGNRGKNRCNALVTSHSIDEKNTIVKDMIRLYRKYLNINPSIKQRRSNEISIIVYNTIFAEMCFKLFGNRASKKRIPYCFVKAPIEFVYGFISGLIDGDGHYEKHRNGLTLTFSSLNMMNGLKQMIARTKTVPVFKKHMDIAYRMELSQFDSWKIASNPLCNGYKFAMVNEYNGVRKNRNTVVVGDNYIGYMVKEISVDDYHGTVYDIEIDHAEAPAFLTGFGIVHNSRPYPMSPGYGENIPIFGKLTTIGSSLQHKEELVTASNRYASQMGIIDSYGPGEGFGGGTGGYGGQSDFTGMSFASGGGANYESPFVNPRPEPISMSSMEYRAGEALYTATELFGLRGFAFSVGKEAITGSQNLQISSPVLASAGEMTNLSRSFFDMELGGMLGLCLREGSRITTNKGIVKIENITGRHDVHGISGFTDIKAISKRKPKDGEQACTFHFKGYDLSVTEDHEIYIMTPYTCKHDKHKTCKPYKRCGGDGKKYICPTFTDGEAMPLWRAAKDITVDDYVGIFIKDTGYSGGLVIDFSKYGVVCSDKRMFRYRKISEDSMKVWNYLDEYGCKNLTGKKLSIKTGVNAQKAHIVLNQFREGVKHESRYMKIDDLIGFSWLVGLYTGDGSCTNTNMEISHDVRDSNTNHKKLEKILDRIGIKANLNVGMKDSWDRTRFSHIGLSGFMKLEVGTRYNNKKVPEYIWGSSLDARIAYISGLVDSDGAYTKDGIVIGIKNASLIEDIQTLCLMSGIYCTATIENKIGVSSLRIPISFCDRLLPYSTKVKREYRKPYIENTTGAYIYNNILWIKIQDITYSDLDRDEYVYDIILSDSFHGFIANNVIVHNSEIYRRFVPRQRTDIELYNPIRNCIVPGTKVEVDITKTINIEDIDTLNHTIRTHRNSCVDSYKLFSRQYIGDVVKVKLSTSTISESLFTTEHLIKVVSTKCCHDHPERNTICLETRRTKICDACGYNDFNEERYGTHKHYLDYNVSWKKAAELNPNDYVLYPIHKTDETLSMLDVSTYISDDFNIHDSYISKRSSAKIPRFIELNYEFGYLCGLYISEGSRTSRNRAIKFALYAKEETTLAAEISDISMKIFGVPGKNRIDENKLECLLHSKAILQLMTGLFGDHSHRKRIPSMLLQHAKSKYLAGILHGCFEGDGTTRGNNNVVKIVSSSESLIRGLLDIALQNGIMGSLHKRSDNTIVLSLSTSCRSDLINMIDFHYGYKIQSIQHLKDGKKSQDWFFFEENIEYVAKKISSIETLNYEGTVYDIGIVGNDHEFCVDGYIVHNSMPEWMPDQNYYIDMQHGDPYCVSLDTLVEIDKLQFREAGTISNVDLLLTHKGNLMVPMHVKTRTMRTDEKAYKISVASLHGIDSRVTEEHPYLVVPTTSRKKSLSSDNLIWVQAKDLQVGMYCAYPRPKSPDNPFEKTVIDMSHIMESQIYTDRYVYYGKMTKERAEIYEYLELNGIRDFKHGERKQFLTIMKWNDKTYENAVRDIKCNTKPYRVERFITIDSNLSYLIGVALAEGFFSNHKVGFALHVNESETIAKNIVNIFAETPFYRDNPYSISHHTIENTNGMELHIHSKALSMFLKYMIGSGSKEKRLNDIFDQMNSQCIGSLIRGYVDGDGSRFISDDKYYLSMKSANRILLLQIRKLLLKLGYVGSIVENKAKTIRNCKACPWFNSSENMCITDDCEKNGKLIKSGISYNLVIRGTDAIDLSDLLGYDITDIVIPKRKVTHTHIDDNYVYMRINKIEEVKQPETVIGYQVEGDNSFCIAGIATHNTTVNEGEMRLPGAGYETTHDVKFTMPISSEAMGRSLEWTTNWYVGDVAVLHQYHQQREAIEPMKQRMMEELEAQQRITKAKTSVYAPQLDLSAHVDAVVQGERGPQAMIIRPMEDSTINPANISEINAFLNLSGIEQGVIVGIDPETGMTEQMQVRRSAQQFNRDIQTMLAAQNAALDAVEEREKQGFPDMHANMYSRVDRLKILGDVAMYSQEYRETLKEVEAQAEAGFLDSMQMRKFEQTKEQIEEKKERIKGFQYRFINQGTPATWEEYDRQAEIREKYGFVERAVGGAWERLSTLRSPIHGKLLHQAHILDEYGRNEIWGRGFKLWNNPYDDYIRPYIDTFLAERDTLQGAFSYGLGGFIFGGPLGATLGAVAGSTWATAADAVGYEYMPEYRTEQRRINQSFDALEYQKWQKAYQETGDYRYKYRAENTITGLLISPEDDPNNIIRAADKPERYYLQGILELGTVEERQRALAMLPSGLSQVVNNYWNRGEGIPQQDAVDRMLGEHVTPNNEWLGWRRDVNLEDIRTLEYMDRGLNAHDTGLGFYCIPYYIYISTSYGRVQIQYIKEGDTIMNRKGKDKVEKVHKRTTHNESITTIRTKKNKIDKIVATSNHEILIYECRKCKYKERHTTSEGLYCTPYSRKKECIDCKPNGEVKWVPIGQIDEDIHYLMVKRQDIRRQSKEIDALNYIETVFDNKRNEELYVSRNGEMIMIGKNQNGAYRGVVIPRYYKPSYDLYRLFGIWLSDGCFIKTINKPNYKVYGLDITIHSENHELIKFVCDTIEQYFGIIPKIYGPRTKQKRNCVSVRVNSVPLGYLFLSLFGEYAKDKTIHHDIINNADEKSLLGLLRGINDGDGTIKWENRNGEKTPYMSFFMIAEEVIRTIYSVAINIGMDPSITLREKDGLYMMSLYGLKPYNAIMDGKKLPNKSKYIYHSIESITPGEYTGDVYDLTIEGDHSYSNELCTFHNSQMNRINRIEGNWTDISAYRGY